MNMKTGLICCIYCYLLTLITLVSSVDRIVPGLTAPGFAAPGFAAPDMIAPDMTAPGLNAITEPVFEAENIGAADFARIEGVSWKLGCPVPVDDLRLLKLTYLGFDGRVRVGELICHRLVAGDLTEIFRELYEMEFPIGQIRLVDEYGANDTLSMEDNNTSAFNYRVVDGTSNLSKHAYGLAVDINPVQNPYIEGGGAYVSPDAGREYLDRGNVRPGMITRGDDVYNAFVSRGWIWGGGWRTPIDYQHFQKNVKLD